jgi:hypothetical protein
MTSSAPSERTFQIAGAGDAGHFRAKRFGNLHAECADAAGGAVDQNRLLRLKLSFVAQRLQSCECCDRYGCGMFERHGFGLLHQFCFGGAGKFSKCALTNPVNRVAGLELSNVSAGRVNNASNVGAEVFVFGLAQTCHQADGVWFATHEVPIVGIERSGANFDGDFGIAGNRALNIFTSENVRGTVFVVDDCFHDSLVGGRCRPWGCERKMAQRGARNNRESRRSLLFGCGFAGAVHFWASCGARDVRSIYGSGEKDVRAN